MSVMLSAAKHPYPGTTDSSGCGLQNDIDVALAAADDLEEIEEIIARDSVLRAITQVSVDDG